mgnify:CR=1 FL=1
MMGNTYVMLADCIPAERTGIYMGIFNMFIVIPMMIQIYTFWQFDLYNSLLGGDPRMLAIYTLPLGLLTAGALMLQGMTAHYLAGATFPLQVIAAGFRVPICRRAIRNAAFMSNRNIIARSVSRP